MKGDNNPVINTKQEGPKASLARLAALLLCLFIFLCIHTVYPEIDVQRDYPRSQEYPGIAKPRKVLHANPIQFDEFRGKLAVNWRAIIPKEVLFVPFAADSYLVAVYQNESLVHESSNIIDYLDGIDRRLSAMAQYRIANATARPTAILGDHTRDYFSVNVKLEQPNHQFLWKGFPSIYPFDRWAGETTFVANIYDLAREWELPGSFGISFDDAIMTDDIFNWKLTIATKNSCTDLRDSQANPCPLVVNFTAKRNGAIIFTSLAVFMTNWFITLVIIIMTVRPHSFVSFRDSHLHSPNINKGKNLNLFYTMAFTALYCTRTSLPVGLTSGALIDVFGFFPNLIIAFSCVLLTISSRFHESAQNDITALASSSDVKSTNTLLSERKVMTN